MSSPAPYRDSFASSTSPSSTTAPTTPTTPTTPNDTADEGIKNSPPSSAQRKSSSSNLLPLPEPVLEVLHAYDCLARDKVPSLPAGSTASVTASSISWPLFSPEHYELLQSILTATLPPAEWAAAAGFHRTKAREEYLSNTLRIRMPTSIHDGVAVKVTELLVSAVKSALEAHPVEKKRWKVAQRGSEDVLLRNNTKRSPDDSISVKRHRAHDGQSLEEQESEGGAPPRLAGTEGAAASDLSQEDPREDGDGSISTPVSPPPAEDFHPAVVIEVGFSNKADHSRKADEDSSFSDKSEHSSTQGQDLPNLTAYIDDSDGWIRTVLYIDIEYLDRESRQQIQREARGGASTTPPTTLTLFTLKPDPANPSVDEISRFDDVLFPAPDSKNSTLELSLHHFLPEPATPDSPIQLSYASLRAAVSDAWETQLQKDKPVRPPPRGRKLKRSIDEVDVIQEQEQTATSTIQGGSVGANPPVEKRQSSRSARRDKRARLAERQR